MTKLKTQHWLAILIVVAILIRVIVAIGLGDRAEPVSGAFDQYSYDALAQRVLAGKGFSFPTEWYPFTSADEPTAHWSYLYTIYLTGVYAVFGHHPLAARLIQVLLSGLNIWLIYRIGARLFGEWVGLAAAALTTVYAYLIFFNATLMTQTFYILTVLATIDITLGLVEKPTRRGWILLGIAIGIGALIRQTLLIFTPLLMLWIVWMQRRQIKWRDVLIALVVIGLFILPWTIYNYFTFRDFLLLNSNGGYWFYSSNHPNQGISFDQNYVAPLPVGIKEISEPAADRLLFQQGIGFILADPVRFLQLSLSRIPVYFWVGASEQSGFWNNLARIGSFTLYLPFMLYGLYRSKQKWVACVPLYLYVVFDTSLSLISWAAPRYRLPSDAILMVFAGLALVSLAERLKLIPSPEFSRGTS